MSQSFADDDGALRMWFRDEIRDALLSAYATASAVTSPDSSSQADAFRRGFVSALIAIGLSFGISTLRFPEHGPHAITEGAVKALGSQSALRQDPTGSG